MNGIVMLKPKDCICETCLRVEHYGGSIYCHLKPPTGDGFDASAFQSVLFGDCWCCQGLWRDPNGRIWTWEEVLKSENMKEEF